MSIKITMQSNDNNFKIKLQNKKNQSFKKKIDNVIPFWKLEPTIKIVLSF